MSIFLGTILSNDISCEQLKIIREKYNLGLKFVCNKYVSAQLSKNERFLRTTNMDFDDLTGIGSYNLYYKDLTPLKNTFTDPIMLESILAEYFERRAGYKADAIRWIQIIKDLKYNFRINTFGLFWHFFLIPLTKKKSTLWEKSIFK